MILQLTNNSLGETAKNLSKLVRESVESLVDQSTSNLNGISSTFANVANYVNTSNAMIEESVS